VQILWAGLTHLPLIDIICIPRLVFFVCRRHLGRQRHKGVQRRTKLAAELRDVAFLGGPAHRRGLGTFPYGSQGQQPTHTTIKSHDCIVSRLAFPKGRMGFSSKARLRGLQWLRTQPADSRLRRPDYCGVPRPPDMRIGWQLFMGGRGSGRERGKADVDAEMQVVTCLLLCFAGAPMPYRFCHLPPATCRLPCSISRRWPLVGRMI
jgi:hypothetical protein